MSLALNNNVQKVFQNTWIRFSIHVILLTGLILIGQRYWQNFKQRQEINLILEENKSLATSNSILKLQKDYFESSFFAEKSAKESQWKNIGERVVDTNNLNENSKKNEVEKYIPNQNQKEISNPEKWLNYLFWDNSNHESV